ncbi:acetolactate synthase [Dichomitus squalens]|uniref:Acetolactate synthase n=1 Tax=Dichomitus squalens TaxID=114155 RepID=A0A4Q9MUS8_9APHY|nr:acetolactate synthase [Dichomitus squalens]TBU41670.1 acetolactate synthase [Dichomitus squalens]TBU64321.1 acetolactate synthase [Dichomitus squalens]
MSNIVASTVRTRLTTAAAASRRLKPRYFTTSLRRQDEQNAPKPPPPIDDSTSALDYKRTLRHRPPPLPAMDLPRLRTAEEAVTNILYNTPPPSLQPFKKHVLNCLVQNEPGVLSRVSGILAGRGFNIDSLVVCRTEIRDLSRMCIVLRGQDGVVEQARRQLEDLVPVWAVLDYTDTHCIERELLLAKVSILGPEYLEEQLVGGPTHEPRRISYTTAPTQRSAEPTHEHTKLEREAALVHQFEHSAEPSPHPEAEADPAAPLTEPLTPIQALRLKSDNLQAIQTLSAQFGGRIVDVSEHSVIVEMCGKTKRVEAFLSLLKPFGVLESARTGLMVMPRTPIKHADDTDVVGEGGVVDASLLPPG